MHHFLIRIELHNAVWPDDYNKLHVAMNKEGFVNIITGSDNITYQLPTAEYYIYSSSPIETIEFNAIRASQTIGKKFAIVIAECSQLRWEGLAPIKK